MNNLFKTKFDAAVIVLIPACIGFVIGMILRASKPAKA